MRTPSAKTQSVPLDTVITDTLKLWRRHHLTYDQTRYVAKEVRRAMAIARPLTRQRVITPLSRVEEERLIGQAYRVPGRSEEHTSELQSLAYLVCRLLLEKKKPEGHHLLD